MHYVITGSLGNISQPVVKKLVAAGHTVKVITSNQQRVADIEALGAMAAVGSVEDATFVKEAFAGADVVYTMVPPKWDAADWKAHIAMVGSNYAEAIKANDIKWVVNLSSVGAHMPDGCGPVSGLYRAEQALNQPEDVNILHLRPGYFYSNLLANVGMVKHMGIIGSNNSADSFMPISDTSDVADEVASALLNLDFKGHSIQYLASDETTPSKIAAALGTAIGNPALPWVEFTDEQSTEGMVQAGLPGEVASNYTEMGSAMRSGKMMEEYQTHKPASLGKVKLNDFAKVFAAAYSA